MLPAESTVPALACQSRAEVARAAGAAALVLGASQGVPLPTLASPGPATRQL